MNIKPLHIILFLFFVICFSEETFSEALFQNPENSRHFDENFKERYTGNQYNYEGKKAESQTMTGSGNYTDYTDGTPKIDEDNNSFSFDFGFFNPAFIKWFFYAILALAVLALVYMLLTNGKTGVFAFNRNKNVAHNDDITAENIENTDINSLIQNAENNNDYRLAIRYYYLLVLKNLSLKNHIKFEDDKTNSEYLTELNNKPFYNEFGYNLYLYNYIWYGDFPINTEQYSKAKQYFTNFLSRIK
ncbi:MAG: hypothetical protein ACK5NB_10460 [Flavobacteriaceae bacterium]